MRRLLLTVLSTVLVVAFQNCSQMGAETTSEGKGEQVVGQTSHFTRVIYDPSLEYPSLPNSERVDIDIANGTLHVSSSSLNKTCAMDADRLSAIADLIATSSVCAPEVPPGTISCMAIALADVEITNGAESVRLRPVACNYGTFLCDGRDSVLRGILADIKTNLPSGCQ